MLVIASMVYDMAPGEEKTPVKHGASHMCLVAVKCRMALCMPLLYYSYAGGLHTLVGLS